MGFLEIPIRDGPSLSPGIENEKFYFWLDKGDFRGYGFFCDEDFFLGTGYPTKKPPLLYMRSLYGL